MDFIANWLIQGCVVALATVVIVRCLLPRAPAAARYLACWVGLSAVLALPLVSLIPVAPSQVHGVTFDATASAALVSLPHSPTSVPLIIGAWLVWLAVFGTQLTAAMVALQRARQRCRAFPLALEGRLPIWARVKHQGRFAQLVVSDDVRAAAVIGCGAPVIAVAPALVQHLTAAELDRVVIHEWAHVQRRDDLGNVAQLMARLVAGWHPGIWWLDRWLRAEREVACDEMAVMLTGSSKTYAACLVKLASLPLASRDTVASLGRPLVNVPCHSRGTDRLAHRPRVPESVANVAHRQRAVARRHVVGHRFAPHRGSGGGFASNSMLSPMRS